MAECPQSHFSSHHSHHWPQSLSVTLSPKLKLSHLSHGLVLSHSGSLVSGLAHSLSRTQGRRCALYRRLAFKLVVVLCVVSRRRQKQTESTSDPSAGGRCHLLASARLVSFLHSQLVPGQAHSFTSNARLLPFHSNSKNQTNREERTGLSWCFASFVRLCARFCPAHASEYASALFFSDLV
ncbi:hypothetical protein AHAS_Ahas03G0093900 [Arachis hypogaea]